MPVSKSKNQNLAKSIIPSLPTSPGVYLFYGTEDLLLYVGKSKNIRARVRSHFSDRDERWLTKRIRRIEARETAGELGALLLESQLIKELRPMYNVRSRQPRRIIIARRVENEQGYATVKLEAVDYLELKPDSPILGIFKHKTQAKEFLDTVSKTHRLCSKLLRLETSQGYCFSYHLGRCDGACMGEEEAAAYNARVEAAFEARRIIAWPFNGPITIEEISKDKKLREVFVVDNWCLVGGNKEKSSPDSIVPLYNIASSGSGGVRTSVKTQINIQKSVGRKLPPPQKSSPQHRFDYDSYKILYSYIMEKGNKVRIQEVKIAIPTKPSEAN